MIISINDYIFGLILTEISSQVLYALDLFGTVVFAISGALVACQQRNNWLVGMLYAALTALGGGTIRDVLLGQQPVFWMRSPLYFWVALAVGLCTFLINQFVVLRHKPWWLADVVSLAIFTVVGTQATISADIALPISLAWVLPALMGVVTGTGGGIVRDTLASRTPYFMKDVYHASNSFIGGIFYSILIGTVISPLLAVGLGVSTIIMLEVFCQMKRDELTQT